MAVLSEVKVGATFQKGKFKRKVVGFDGLMVYYKTPSSGNKTTGEIVSRFNKWLTAAVKVS
ncbi:hypothetical protein [Bacillus mycoides]|uniref:hypothetical protein n=1 Tax=Bacillus mycoides TaxID=1405 RepID=UPI003A7FC825